MKLHCTVLVHCLVHFIFRLLDKVVLTMSNKLHDPHTIHILPILEDSRFCYHGMKSLCSISRDAVTMHPKIMEAKISVIKFWQCFFRLKCIFLSFVYFFSNFRFFFFFFAWQYVWFLLFPRSCDEQSNQIPCSQDVVTWSHLHQDSDEDSVRNLLWFFVCKSIMSHHTQIDLILFIFFSRVVFLPMVRLTWGFCTDEINSNNTKLSIRYNVTVEFISPLYDTNTGELLFFF